MRHFFPKLSSATLLLAGTVVHGEPLEWTDLTEAERERALRNYEQYRALDAADRERIHDQYEVWKLLTPDQRDQIRERWQRRYPAEVEEAEQASPAIDAAGSGERVREVSSTDPTPANGAIDADSGAGAAPRSGAGGVADEVGDANARAH